MSPHAARNRGIVKHKCCPWIPQTWLALGLLLFGIFCMAILQLFPDSIPSYPPECQSLSDLGFSIVPHLNDYMGLLADILVLIVLVSFLVLVPFVLETPQLVIRRWFILLTTLYVLRGIAVIATRYPQLPYKSNVYQPSNPLLGALLIMTGAKTTATDIMYSGHTVNFVLAASFVSRYTRYGVFSMFYWLIAVAGMFALIATREHYTADVFIGFIVTKLAFWCYHLFFDSLYMRFWVSGLHIRDTGGAVIALPAELKGADGASIQVEADMVNPRQVRLGVDYDTGQLVDLVNLQPVSDMRYEIYRWFSWFDAE